MSSSYGRGEGGGGGGGGGFRNCFRNALPREPLLTPSCAPRQDGSSQLYAQAADALDEMDAIELATWRESRTGQRHGDVAARRGAVTPGSTIGAFGGAEKVIDPGPARPHTAAALLGRAPRCGPRPFAPARCDAGGVGSAT